VNTNSSDSKTEREVERVTSPCPPITWHNVLHGWKVLHFTIILNRSIVDSLWLSIAQSHTFVLNLQHLNPVSRCCSQALNLIWLSIGLFPNERNIDQHG